MNKYDLAMEKVSDRIGNEWRKHGWRGMTNEEVDRDVQEALLILDDLVEAQRLFRVMYKAYVLTNEPLTDGAKELRRALERVEDEILLHLGISFSGFNKEEVSDDE